MPRKRSKCSKTVKKLAEERNASFIAQEVPPPDDADTPANDTDNVEEVRSGGVTSKQPDETTSNDGEVNSNHPEETTSDASTNSPKMLSGDASIQSPEDTAPGTQNPFDNPAPGCSGLQNVRKIQLEQRITYNKRTCSNATSMTNGDRNISVSIQTEMQSDCGELETENLAIENSKLRRKVATMRQQLATANASNARMQMALTSALLPAPTRPFEEIEGYPNSDTLLGWSVEARDSDYLFVKFIMMNLWPEGFAGRSLTGRSSNNPKGRPRRNADPVAEGNGVARPVPAEARDDQDQHVDEAPPVLRRALEPERVEYIRDRLLERRLLLRDNGVVAARVAAGYKRLIHSVLSNKAR